MRSRRVRSRVVSRIREDTDVTSLPDVPSSATWRCVDLHLHTPGVHSVALPGGTDERTAAHREQITDQYVQRLRAGGIEVATITDYRGVQLDWSRRRAEKYGGPDDA